MIVSIQPGEAQRVILLEELYILDLQTSQLGWTCAAAIFRECFLANEGLREPGLWVLTHQTTWN